MKETNMKNNTKHMTKKEDENLKSQGVKILPWVGGAYEEGIQGKKVMVLGYSLYGNKPEDSAPDALRVRVDLYCNGEFEPWMNTYTKSFRALFGDPTIIREDCRDLFEKIVFYNYVQEPLTGARVDPTDEQLLASIVPFKAFLEEYLPDVIITWGKSLFQVLPGFEDDFKGHKGTSIEGADVWIYNIGGHEITVLEMTHPSAAFSYEYWSEVIRKLLSRPMNQPEN